jgi:hypothetical protein
MESPTGIIPEELMYPELKDQVVAFLISQPLPSWTKRRLLAGWATTVNTFPTMLDYHTVVASGIDRPLPIGAVK